MKCKNIVLHTDLMVECGTEMEKMGDVVTNVNVSLVKGIDSRYIENTVQTVPLYQCPSCKSIKLD